MIQPTMMTTSRSIYDELTSREITVTPLQLASGGTLLSFGYNGKLRTITGSSPDLTHTTASTICNDKNVTRHVALALGVPIPETIVYSDDAQAESFLKQHTTVVAKPVDGAHGRGVTTNITTAEHLHQSIEGARQHYSTEVLLQQQVSGVDYRILVIGGKMAACAERISAWVEGDGTRTIRQLIDQENTTNTRRGVNYENVLNKIDVSAAERYLGAGIDIIPPKQTKVSVVGTANIGTGGEATDRTQVVPESMQKMAEWVANEIGCFVCGVDFMYDQTADTWYLIELNSSPSFGLHMSPSKGDAVDVTKLFVDRLFAVYDA
jgi:cyanophycin synthetase